MELNQPQMKRRRQAERIMVSKSGNGNVSLGLLCQSAEVVVKTGCFFLSAPPR